MVHISGRCIRGNSCLHFRGVALNCGIPARFLDFAGCMSKLQICTSLRGFVAVADCSNSGPRIDGCNRSGLKTKCSTFSCPFTGSMLFNLGIGFWGDLDDL